MKLDSHTTAMQSALPSSVYLGGQFLRQQTVDGGRRMTRNRPKTGSSAEASLVQSAGGVTDPRPGAARSAGEKTARRYQSSRGRRPSCTLLSGRPSPTHTPASPRSLPGPPGSTCTCLAALGRRGSRRSERSRPDRSHCRVFSWVS